MNTFTLSLAAVDVLWRDLKLGARPFPLEFPYHGRTHDERRAIRGAVLRDLEARGLAHRGRPLPEVEDALSVLVRFEFALSAVAALDQRTERRLCARGAAAGEFAVLATIDEQSMRVDLLRRGSLLRAVVDLSRRTGRGPVSRSRSPRRPPHRRRPAPTTRSAACSRPRWRPRGPARSSSCARPR